MSTTPSLVTEEFTDQNLTFNKTFLVIYFVLMCKQQKLFFLFISFISPLKFVNQEEERDSFPSVNIDYWENINEKYK